MNNHISPDTVLNFWFHDHNPKDWFQKNDGFDQEIKNLFLPIHQQAVKGELFSWRSDVYGRLAEIIILDQFSRNMFRNTSASFAYDNLALFLAQETIRLQLDKQLTTTQKQFLYMPYMHSESSIIHEEAVKLFKKLNNPETLKYEYQHQNIIKTFGRYPHRNKILNRSSTKEEIAFLKTPGSSF